MGKNKILLIGLFASLAFLIPFMFQDVYAQSSATVTLFGTNNASDDTCSAITQTGSVIWLGCFSSAATTTLRINAVSGNSTIATVTLASQNANSAKFFTVDADSIALVDISGTSEVVREYTLSGSTITNTRSVTLTNCGGGGYRPQTVGTSLFYMCSGGTEAGKIKIVNLNTFILTSTLSTLIQGNCAAPQAISMLTTAKGVVFCDNTEANLFTVAGSTITFTDELTAWASVTTNRTARFTGQTAESFTVWTLDTDGDIIQVATVDADNMTWDSGITTVPSQADAVEMLALFTYMFTIDDTDENILVYDWRNVQPDTALANFSGGGLVISASSGFSVSYGGTSLLIASTVTDAGRYFIVSDIIIDGDELGETPDDPFDTGIDCSLPENSSKLICRLPTGGITTNLGNATGREITELTCQVIFQTCEDTDPKTNGMGLLYFIGSIFVVVGMFYYVLGTDRVANIPLFVWIIIVIALSAFFTLGGWIDPVFLIISIVGVIALAAPTLINKIGGKSNGFGGGSTE